MAADKHSSTSTSMDTAEKYKQKYTQEEETRIIEAVVNNLDVFGSSEDGFWSSLEKCFHSTNRTALGLKKKFWRLRNDPDHLASLKLDEETIGLLKGLRYGRNQVGMDKDTATASLPDPHVQEDDENGCNEKRLIMKQSLDAAIIQDYYNQLCELEEQIEREKSKGREKEDSIERLQEEIKKEKSKGREKQERIGKLEAEIENEKSLRKDAEEKYQQQRKKRKVLEEELKVQKMETADNKTGPGLQGIVDENGAAEGWKEKAESFERKMNEYCQTGENMMIVNYNLEKERDEALKSKQELEGHLAELRKYASYLENIVGNVKNALPKRPLSEVSPMKGLHSTHTLQVPHL